MLRSRIVPVLMNSRAEYWQKIVSLFGASIVAYLPLWEPSGSAAVDIVNGRNGTYTNITLNNRISPAGKPSPLFSSSYVTLPAAFNAAFNGLEGGVGFFVKAASGFWTNGLTHVFARFSTGANTISCGKNAANVIFGAHTAGGVAKVLQSSVNYTGDFHVMLTWSDANDRFAVYVNGVPVISVTGIGTWSGGVSGSYIGWNTSTAYHAGWLSDFVVLSGEPAPAQVKLIATAKRRPVTLGLLGDSNTAEDTSLIRWPVPLANLGYNAGWVDAINHAAGGATIAAQLAGQVTASANDDADRIINNLGGNDDNAGNMATLQALVETAIDDLAVSNPRATQYILTPFPRWTDVGGGTEIDKSNIRTMLAAAGAAKGVTVLDGYTIPGLTADLTSDGTHWLAAGYQIIAEWLASRI